MKKLSLFLLSMIALNAQAQNKFAIGIKLGQNFSSVNNVNVDRNAASPALRAFAAVELVAYVASAIASSKMPDKCPAAFASYPVV